jgi:hypothetical protein
MKSISAAVLSLIATAAVAQVPVDISQSKISIDSSQTLNFENVNVPGLGSFQLKFRWNPHNLTFDPIVETLTSNGPYCEKAVATGNVSYSTTARDAYLIRQRTTATMTVGALTAASNRPYGFTAAWAKTQTANENPYLTGKALPSFDPNKSYGIIGTVHTGSYTGFDQGMLVEITGSLAAGVFNIKQVGGTGSTTFTVSPNSASSTPNCLSSSAGIYSGNTSYSSANANAYQVAYISAGSGSITAATTPAYGFTATWDNDIVGKRGFQYGRVASVHTGSYSSFTTAGTVFLADFGDGLAITALSDTQEAIGTAVFTK